MATGTVGPVSDVTDAKRELRRTMREMRRALAEPEALSERLWSHVRALPEITAATTVMVFDSIPGEPMTAPFIEWCRSQGKTVALPEDEPAIDPRLLDVVIVPGLAFTAAGNRLGQGGGWYDRFLPRLRTDCVTVGVGYGRQLIDELPVEPHDVQLTLVITEAGIATQRPRERAGKAVSETGRGDGATTCTFDLDVLLQSLAPSPLIAGVRRINPSDIRDLTASESEVVSRAVDARRAEFASGRALLRFLLGQGVEIMTAQNGSPLLPDGWAGSLAHDHEFVVGLVGPVSVVRSVGIDLEPIQELGDDVAGLVIRPDDRVPDPLTGFVSKEAVYKAWSCIGGGMIEHHDVSVVASGSQFVANVRDELSVEGVLGRACNRIVAIVAIPT
jgi:5-formyltetrahydrofolate cyclo-ligase